VPLSNSSGKIIGTGASDHTSPAGAVSFSLGSGRTAAVSVTATVSLSAAVTPSTSPVACRITSFNGSEYLPVSGSINFNALPPTAASASGSTLSAQFNLTVAGSYDFQLNCQQAGSNLATVVDSNLNYIATSNPV